MSLNWMEWMEWTPPTFGLFVTIISCLVILTLWDIRSPSVPHKGFLPLAFTRGERFFLSIVTLVGTVILWIAFLPDIDWQYALGVAVVLIVILVRWG